MEIEIKIDGFDRKGTQWIFTKQKFLTYDNTVVIFVFSVTISTFFQSAHVQVVHFVAIFAFAYVLTRNVGADSVVAGSFRLALCYAIGYAEALLGGESVVTFANVFPVYLFARSVRTPSDRRT